MLNDECEENKGVYNFIILVYLSIVDQVGAKPESWDPNKWVQPILICTSQSLTKFTGLVKNKSKNNLEFQLD